MTGVARDCTVNEKIENRIEQEATEETETARGVSVTPVTSCSNS